MYKLKERRKRARSNGNNILKTVEILKGGKQQGKSTKLKLTAKEII
jgi:hypothetical protein